jgi:hypothetical protein
MAVGTERRLVDAVRFDLRRMHETWMEFIYPRQRGASDTVLGKWTPDGGIQMYLYRLWSAIGVPVVGLLYPLVLLGYFVRFQTRRLNVTAARIGFVGVVGLFVVLWGALSALVAFPLADAVTSGGVLAVVAASSVAVVSSALAFGFWWVDGRTTTILLAYPFAMTAIFLPPVVAALFSTVVPGWVLTESNELAVWLLDLSPETVETYLRENYELRDYAYLIMWFGISVPLGWLLGIVVTLADLVRPTSE